MMLLNIPVHTNCKNCGECCYFAMCSEREKKAILQYVEKHNIQPKIHEDGRCRWHDNKEKKCLIYPVRPVVCKLMGVTKGMQCINGNTTEIDGSKFIDRKSICKV